MIRLKISRLTIPKLTIFGTAAIVAAALASPAMAQQVISNPGYCAQFYPNANCQNTGPGNPYTGGYQRQARYRGDPYRNDDVSWNNGWNDDNGYSDDRYNGGRNQSYTERNGFVCSPGTWFKGDDGRRHRCQ
jgi:hypothetical protein